MKRQFIILVMAGMLLVPYGSVFASSGGIEKPVGYVFPTAQSVIVLGSDGLSGTALSPDEVKGYSHVPWVSLDPSVLNVNPGYNLFDLFSYGCEGFDNSELSVKILIAPTYQEEAGGAFITGLFEDVTSNPIITEEGAYAYKIIVSKPCSDSPLSVIETGYLGVSKSSAENTTSPESRTAPLASSVAGSGVEAVDTSVEVALPVSDVVVAPVDAGNTVVVESPSVSVDVPNDVIDGSLDTGSAVVCDTDLPCVEGSSLESSSLEISSSLETSAWSPTTDYGRFMYDTYGLRWWDDYGRGTDWKEHCDVYPVQSSVSSAKILRVVELINQHRIKNGLNPLLLDQTTTRGCLVRAAECNIFFDHTRPGDGYANIIAGGSTIITVGGDTPEKSVNAWINSPSHNSWLLSRGAKYIGVGQVGNSWVCDFGYEEDDAKFKQADSTFLKSIEMSNRVDYVLVDRSVCSPKLEAYYYDAYCLGRGIAKGSTYQLGIKIPTIYWKAVNNSASVVPSALTWKSSNPKVASVDSNGNITGLYSGTSVITASLNGQTVSTTVKVNSDDSPVTPPVTEYLVKYRTHIQNIGWQGYVSDGMMSGTSGKSYRLEGINVALDPSVGGGIEYRTHVQNIGWQNYVSNGAMSGTEGLGYRLEAINIRLTGEAAQKYDVYYRTHVQNVGWMGWAKNGESSGSAGFGYRLEGIEIQLVAKGAPAPGSTAKAFVENK